MLDDNKLTDILVPIFQPILEASDDCYPLVVTHQDYLRPETPFATLEVLQYQMYGRIEHGAIIDGTGQFYRQDMKGYIRLSAYGKKARQKLNTLTFTLDTPSLSTTLCEAGISVIDKGIVKSLPEVLNKGWEERAVVDLELAVSIGSFASDEIPTSEDEGKPGVPWIDPTITSVASADVTNTPL